MGLAEIFKEDLGLDNFRKGGLDRASTSLATTILDAFSLYILEE